MLNLIFEAAQPSCLGASQLTTETQIIHSFIEYDEGGNMAFVNMFINIGKYVDMYEWQCTIAKSLANDFIIIESMLKCHGVGECQS